ncbi:MAG: phosphoribosylformylglycinamidine synthase subunit PurS [Campylobacterota bacterium]
MAKATVNIYLKNGVLDPQGKATQHALKATGFHGVTDVRIGKQVVLDLAEGTSKKEVEQMCETLLANTVIEDFDIKMDQ